MTDFLLYGVLPTLLFLPLYLKLRKPFLSLPLHRDTGFYVSNETICSKKICYRKGWNASYAMCSKVLPEFFYSWIYLKHGAGDYPFLSRYYYTFYNYLTAIAVAVTAYVISDYAWLAYVTALVCYGLLSSLPHFGVYFESGEQFEGMFQSLGFSLVFLGVAEQLGLLAFLGISIFLLESFFIKTSSLVITAIIEISIAYNSPWMHRWLLAANIISFLIYWVWIKVNGQSLRALFFPGIKHERYSQGGITIKKITNQVSRKCIFLFKCTAIDHPVIPALLLISFIAVWSTNPLLASFLIGCLIVYFIQTALIWYYAIPLLVPVTLFLALYSKMIATHSVLWLLLFVIVWIVVVLMHMKAYSVPEGQRHQRVWRPYGEFMSKQNEQLVEILGELKSIIKDSSMFIFGVTNQAYVLTGNSYPTALISGAAWLDDMAPDWQNKIAGMFLKNPPDFILCSDEFLNTEAIKISIGLDYKRVSLPTSNFKLYQFFQGENRLKPRSPTKFYDTEAAALARVKRMY